MRTLSATLLAAQKRPDRVPYVKVEVGSRIGSVARFIWERLYTGSEPDFYHAATVPGDNSLLRARVDSTNNHLYYQRIASPGPGSAFGTWIDWWAVSSSSGVALASRGARVLLFYVDTAGYSIYQRESQDYGSTWDSPSIVLTPENPVRWLAAAINPIGKVALFYASSDQKVWVTTRSNGVWSNPLSWPHTLSTITGVGCTYQGDWDLAVSGRDSSSNYGVWTCIYGDGLRQAAGTWSSLMEHIKANQGSSVEFHVPFLGYPDTFRLFFVEKYTGSYSYSRPIWSYTLPGSTFDQEQWREPVPFNLASSYGTASASGSTYAWLSTPSGVWRAAIAPASIDVTADVLELTTEESSAGGRARIVLRNDDGRYNSPGTGSLAALRHGSQVAISPGYRTSAGNEPSIGPTFWIDGWTYVTKSGTSQLVLHASDLRSLLEGWRARRSYSWASGSKSVKDLLTFVFTRCGLELSTISTSPAITALKPDFTIHPGESGLEAVRRLLAMVPDVLLFRSGKAYLLNPQSSDPTNYAYGSGHAILEGRYGSQSSAINRVQVFGSTGMGEALEWPEVEDVYDRLLQVHDLNIASAAEAQDRGGRELRDRLSASQEGEIRVAANAGQELYDVIEVTDARAGLSAAKRRVLGLELRYSTQRASYEHLLKLGRA